MPLVFRQLNVEIFGGCNYKCQMCPQSDGREGAFLRKLPYSVYEKILDDALQYGVQSVSLHGSGEPTFHTELVPMVALASSRGLHVSFFTNGSNLTGPLFENLADAGLDMATVSIVGHDRDAYHHWMGRDNFQLVRDNLAACRQVMDRRGGKTEFHTRHLITDRARCDEEIVGYRNNWIEPLQCKAEIWLMHNWCGLYFECPYDRRDLAAAERRRSCGRPFSPTLEIRAGGLDGHTGAVVPCPYVLGQDTQAVLGHLDTQTIAEVFAGAPMQDLQAAHRNAEFDRISYCKDCDQLYDVPAALVWTNIEGRQYGQSKTSSVIYTDFGRS
jgi:organic radical activating enzyme